MGDVRPVGDLPPTVGLGPGGIDLVDWRTNADQFEVRATERLRALVLQESPSGNIELLKRVRDDLAREWKSLGMTVGIVPGPAGDHLVGSFAGGPQGPIGGGPADRGHLLVVSHYDTVWPPGELARQPFRVDGKYVAGPGTFDMKGGIVAFEVALSLLHETGAWPAQEIRIVCVADEEVSSPDGRRTVMAQAEGAAAVVGLEPPHPDGSLKNGRRGVARVRVRVGGRESHAGLDPKKGVSAVDELVDQLLALRQTMPTAGDAGYNVGAIKGGSRANVVAGSAEAEIGLRFWATSTEQAMYKALSSLAPFRDGATVEWEVLSQRPAWPVGENASLVNHVLAVAARLGDQFQARPADGAGDTNITGALGIPTVDGLGPRGRGAHAYGEAVEMASILDRAALLAALMTIGLPTH